jgi:hypothetical protein
MINLLAASVALVAAFIVISFDILKRLNQYHKDTSPSHGDHQPPDNQEESRPAMPADAHRWHPEQSQHHRQERRYWCVIIVVTTLAACGAIASALFTWGALQTARDTETRQLRAYLDLRPGVLTCTECNGPVSDVRVKAIAGTTPKNYVKVFTKNGGVTPAYNAIIKICWWRNESNKALPADFNYVCAAPVDEWTASTTIFGTTEATFLSPVAPADVVSARNRQIGLYMYGQVEYLDAFGADRSTPICQFYNPVESDEHTTFWAECRVHQGGRAN